MKKFIILILTMFSLGLAAQNAPQGISYQAIARNASGAILAGQGITVNFRIFNNFGSGATAYEESHNVTTNPLGYFNLVIGQGVTVTGNFSSINWSTGNASYEIYVNGALLGSETKFFSAPYALYAQQSGGATAYQAGAGIAINSGTITNTAPNQTVSITGSNVSGAYPNYTVTAGNTLPTGTATGNTLWWNGTSTSWQQSAHLFNDNQHVGIGIGSAFSGKLHVHSSANADSSVIFSDHLNAVARTAGVRSVIVGTSPLGQYNTAIMGGNFFSRNLGQGPAVGIATGAESNVANGTAIGLYAFTVGTAPNRWAAMFDGGGVKVNDSLIVGGSGSPGDLLVRSSTGRAVWTNSTTVTSGGSTPVNFSAYGSTSSFPAASVNAVVFQNIDYNNGGGFNGTVFTAPSAGLYHFDGLVTLNTTSAPGGTSYQLQLMNGGGTYRVSNISIPGGQPLTPNQISLDLMLNAGDQIQLGVYHNAGSPLPAHSSNNYTYFTGHKVN